MCIGKYNLFKKLVRNYNFTIKLFVYKLKIIVTQFLSYIILRFSSNKNFNKSFSFYIAEKTNFVCF